jgi:hypothetical protein
MNDTEWRGSEEERDPRREYIRKNAPSGSEGFTAEDLDLIITHFGPNYESDEFGRIRLIEIKTGNETMNKSQKYTLALLDRMCRTSRESFRYQGFFLVWAPTKNWEDEQIITVNGYDLTQKQFNLWLKDDLFVEPNNFSYIPKDLSKWHKRYI